MKRIILSILTLLALGASAHAETTYTDRRGGVTYTLPSNYVVGTSNGGTGLSALCASGKVLQSTGTGYACASVSGIGGVTDVNLGTTATGANPHVTSDDTTGLFSSTASTISFAISGGERFKIGSDGTLNVMGVAGIAAPTTHATVTISKNAATISGASSVVPLHVANADGVATAIMIDSYGAIPYLSFRRANGTAASPTAITSGDVIGQILSMGFMGDTGTGTIPGYNAHPAGIYMVAAENYTATAQGTYIDLLTTATGSNARATKFRLNNDGRVVVGSSATSAPAALSNSMFQVSGADGTSTKAEIIGYGSNASLALRSSSGTSATPTQVKSGQLVGAVGIYPYTSSGWSTTSPAYIRFYADEDQTGTAMGSYITLNTTTTGGTTGVVALKLGSNGDATFGRNIVLPGSTSGTTTLKAPAVAGSTTISFPTTAGSSGDVLTTDGAGNTSWAVPSISGVGAGVVGNLAVYDTATTVAGSGLISHTATKVTIGGVTQIGVSSPPDPLSNSMLQISGTSGTSTKAEIIGYGSNASLALRAASGTSSSPAAVQAGHLIGAVNAYPYTASGWSTTAPANIRFYADESMTGSSMGSYISAYTTATGSASPVLSLQLGRGGNALFGYSAGTALTTGSNNVIVGSSVGRTTLTTGSSNILIGNSSAVDTPAADTSSWLNIGGVITGSMASGNFLNIPTNDNTSGGSIAIGSGALANSSGTSAAYAATAVGYQALGNGTKTTAAIKNTAVGYQALAAITSGQSNTAVGYSAGSSNTAATYNTLIGGNAGKNGTTASFTANVAVGYNALLNNGGENVAVGGSAMSATGTGTKNTAVGRSALAKITTGSTNVGLGYSVGGQITTGSSNVLIGPSVASTTLTTGSNNILIGNSSAIDTATGSTSNYLMIGANIKGTHTTGPIQITYNPTTQPASIVGSVLQLSATDGAASRVELVTAGQRSSLTLRSASGTMESPTSHTADGNLGSIDWYPYTASGWSTSTNASINVKAAESLTGDARGAYMEFLVTATGTNVSSQALKLNNNRTLTVAAYGAGTLTTDASGNVSVTSDERLKNIQGLFTRTVYGFKPILYKWNKKSGLEVNGVYAGFSAQNVAKTCPECVGHNPDGHLTLQDRAVLAATVNSVNDTRQELLAIIERQQKQIQNLQISIETLKRSSRRAP